jgi:hypothetical protein
VVNDADTIRAEILADQNARTARALMVQNIVRSYALRIAGLKPGGDAQEALIEDVQDAIFITLDQPVPGTPRDRALNIADRAKRELGKKRG